MSLGPCHVLLSSKASDLLGLLQVYHQGVQLTEQSAESKVQIDILIKVLFVL